MKNTAKRWLSVLLCLTMICAVGCTQNDDTTVTTTTQEITTTTTVTDTTTTVEDATTENVTTTKDNGTTVTTTTATKNGGATTKVTTTVTTTTTVNQTTTKYNGPVKVITCYGDSVTEGMSVAQDFKYPTVLQQLLGEKYLVQNAGDGGEKTQSIMARQGALKIKLKNDVTFAAGVTQVQIDEGNGRGVLTENGKEVQWTPPYGRDLPMNKVTINGKAYEFKFTNHSYEQNGTCKTFLTRADGSEAITIPKGTEVVINTATTSKSNYCDIYLMGFNGDYTDVNDLIEQHKKMIAYRGNNNYLIIIPFFRKENSADIQAFKDAFGDHALDFFAYSKNLDNIKRAGMTPTNEDKMCISAKKNLMPYRFKLLGAADPNDVHLSAEGYKLLAQALHEQGKKINLW